MNKEIVNIGIIGASGGRMNFSHLPNLKLNKRAHFKAFCDLNIQKTEDIIKEKGYDVDYITDDADKVMQDPDVDLIVAGLPHEIHKDMILKAAFYKKDIFIEKPMVLSPNECYEVLDAVKKSKIRVMIGHNRRFAPIYVDAKRIYKDKMGGKPAILTYRVADPLEYMYKRRPEGGRIYGEECHFFDLLSWFLDAEPVKVYTEGDLADFHITIKFDDGSRAVLISSAQGGMGYPKELFECFCNFQSIIAEGNMCLTHSGECGQVTVTNYPLFFDPYPYFPNDLAGYRQRMANYAKDNYEGKFAEFSHPSGYKGHYEELDACINSILMDEPFAATEIDGARAIVCCDAAVESIETGLPVEIKKEQYFL